MYSSTGRVFERVIKGRLYCCLWVESLGHRRGNTAGWNGSEVASLLAVVSSLRHRCGGWRLIENWPGIRGRSIGQFGFQGVVGGITGLLGQVPGYLS